MLSAFTAGLLLITISELGDKTFFIAMVLAMRHPRRWVLSGVCLALAVMTILSVLLGQSVSFLPKSYLDIAEIVLFLGFGIKLLYDASRMTSGSCETEEQEALEVVQKADLDRRSTVWSILIESFTLTFVAEWGDRTQIATITLAAANHPVGVTLGAVLGHVICAAIAVFGGRFICGRISERTVTTLGGILFLIFAGVAASEMWLAA